MADHADVRSLEQLQVFLEKTERFRAQLLKELENLQLELRRLTNWIESETPAYWTEQLQRAQRRLVECQDTLTRCMSYVREGERKPCSEEKKRLQRAQQRRAICEEKLRIARSAAGAWERQRTKGHAKVQRCRDLAETDLTVAIGHLREQLERLDAYAGLRSAAVSKQSPATSANSQSSTSNAEDCQSEVQATATQGDVLSNPPADPTRRSGDPS